MCGSGAPRERREATLRTEGMAMREENAWPAVQPDMWLWEGLRGDSRTEVVPVTFVPGLLLRSC